MEMNLGVKKTDIGLIPEDWDVVKVGEIFRFKNGLNKEKRFFGYGTPIINYMDVFNNPTLKVESIVGRVEVSVKELESYKVCKGDVFFTRTSETVEEIGIAAVILDEPEKTVYSGFVLRARPINDSLDNLFKAYCFASSYFRQQVISRASYTTRALTNGPSLSASLLARPPIKEQKAIGQALGDVDYLQKKLKRLIKKKRNLKKATMQQLLTGQVRLKNFTDPWVKKNIGQISEFVDGVKTSGGDKNYLEIGDIDVNYKSYNLSKKDKLSVPGAVKVPPNTLLISRVRPTRGAITITKSSLYVSSAFCRIKLSNKFLFYLLSQLKFFIYLGENSMGGTYPTCRDETILNYETYVPNDHNEQIEISKILSDMDDEINMLQSRYMKILDLKKAMMQTLLIGKIRIKIKETIND